MSKKVCCYGGRSSPWEWVLFLRWGGGRFIYSVATVARGGSQERLWFVLIMMLGKALRLFLQAPRSRVHLLI